MNDGDKGNFTDSIKNAAKKITAKAADAKDGIKNAVSKRKDNALAKIAERKNAVAEKKRQETLDKLLPIFADELTPDLLHHERVIRIVNYDARLENEVCKGSVGFYDRTPTRKIPTIYTKYIDSLGLSFFPHLSESVFIADPCIAGNYIEIDEYFNYMKQVRVNELTLIAQSLGAKHVDIRLTSDKKKNSSLNMNANAGGGNKTFSGDAKASKNTSFKSKSKIEIWASTDFKAGFLNNSPVMPNITYFKNESDIQALIQMVLVNKSKVTSRTYSLKASSSSGMSLTEAADINSSLKVIKLNAGGVFEKKANIESEAVLEYSIRF